MSKVKGNRFEREICCKLSDWWEAGREDIFWRTSNSGGRATTRSKGGKKTHRQYGDISAIDPIGQPLIQVFTIELKIGYNKATVSDLLDRPDTAAVQQYEEWFTKLEETAAYASSVSWLLIHKRDRRDALVFFPLITLEHDFKEAGIPTGLLRPLVIVKQNEFPIDGLIGSRKAIPYVCGTSLDGFLRTVRPRHILNICEKE